MHQKHPPVSEVACSAKAEWRKDLINPASKKRKGGKHLGLCL
jgi:hypothetical protein